MTKFLFGSTALALMIAASPASAQLLGGGGGLGGQLGGSLGGVTGAGAGTLGSTIDRGRIGSDTVSSARGASRTDHSVDRRRGRVSASNATSGDSALDGATRIGDRSLTTSGGGSGNVGGSVDAQLVGTDAARGLANDARTTGAGAVSQARNAADGVRATGANAVARGRDTATGAVGRATSLGNASGNATGNGSGMLSGDGASGAGSLALAGSGMVDRGATPVSPGMAVTDARGRAIGTVRSVRSSASGAVERVLVQVGNRTADLPAANFSASGSGNALVSAMDKGAVKDAGAR